MTVVQDEIEKLGEKQAIQKVNNIQGQIVSNIFVKEKKDGTYRMILNLREMNKMLEKTHFKMETLESAISLMKKECYFTSIDLKDT